MAKVKYGNWDLVKELENYERDIERWVKRGIAKTTVKIHNTIISLMPVDTGYLRESVTIDFKDGGFTGVINIGSEYAIYVNYGTGIYATGAGGSRAKKIPWSYKDANGKWHTTKGQHAQPFWEPAIDAGRVFFNKYFS
ncbi:TPA: HK97 gp10 family phage protein [Staphylococcus aureus]|nr:HK97 gp10 family phage protein [Staphylococcus aureus]HAZ5024600.1 HK97 gp10 family phage protein [Staphylococcus aureus]HAZ5142245.1 HK97 gp10 family phage protein [Staphylococcus aureus]HAZ5720886.1 HK97 gp10 family phage protein [Staphylococcus aureus]HAZ6282686.1 HK97 gp10 family phage protein [Staphylococcus aureus]